MGVSGTSLSRLHEPTWDVDHDNIVLDKTWNLDLGSITYYKVIGRQAPDNPEWAKARSARCGVAQGPGACFFISSFRKTNAVRPLVEMSARMLERGSRRSQMPSPFYRIAAAGG